MALPIIRGTGGDDTIIGRGIGEEIIASLGHDFVDAAGGDDRVRGGDGDDTVHGGEGNDWLSGGRGRDFMRGGPGNDTLDGGEDPDFLIGGTGRDTLIGDGGNDLLIGGETDETDWRRDYWDIVAPGDGERDVFVINAYAGDGRDHILDFEPFIDVLLFKQNDITDFLYTPDGLTLVTETGGTVSVGFIGVYELAQSLEGSDFFAPVAEADRIKNLSDPYGGRNPEISGDGFTVVYGDGVLYDDDTETTTHFTSGADGRSGSFSLSHDGTKVAFHSDATNLVPGEPDLNDARDVFHYDATTGDVTNLTLGANGDSGGPSMSGDGRLVALASSATDLVAGQTDANGYGDVFLRDMDTGEFLNVTHGADGESRAASISADGSTIALISDATNLVAGETHAEGGVYLYDVASEAFTHVAGEGYDIDVSGDGTLVVYRGFDAIYLYDAKTGDTDRVSPVNDRERMNENPDISDDGSTVVYNSRGGSCEFARLFVYDVESGESEALDFEGSLTPGNWDTCVGTISANPSISADGSRLAFESNIVNLEEGPVDVNGDAMDVFLFDFA